MSDTRIERHGEHSVYVLEDPAAGSSARILATYGFNCFSFRCRVAGRDVDLLHSDDHFADQPSRPAGNGIPILFPFPNRIRAGRFEFAGRSFQLPRNERGINAIHGLVLDRPWRVEQPHGTDPTVTGRFRLSADAPELSELWPADFQIDLSYTLRRCQLRCQIRITNPDSKPLPWGFGTHPSFRLPLLANGDEQRCTVHAPVGEIWELAELLPTGRRIPVPAGMGLDGSRPLAQLKFDHVFTRLGFRDGWCTSELVDGAAGTRTTLRFDAMFRELVVYTPPARGSISLEPYSCVTDAINLERHGVDAGLRVLAPGESAQGTIVVEASAN